MCLGKLQMSSSEWRRISSDAKDVVRGLLTVKQDRRLTMNELKETPWLAEQMAQIERERPPDGSGKTLEEQEQEAATAQASSDAAARDGELLAVLGYLSQCVDHGLARSFFSRSDARTFLYTGSSG